MKFFQHQSSSSSNIALEEADLDEGELLLVEEEVVVVLLLGTEAVLCPPSALVSLLTLDLGQYRYCCYLLNFHSQLTARLLTTIFDILDKFREVLTRE